MAGLDPAIHPLKELLRSAMDTRVKPAYDYCGCGISSAKSSVQ